MYYVDDGYRIDEPGDRRVLIFHSSSIHPLFILHSSAIHPFMSYFRFYHENHPSIIIIRIMDMLDTRTTVANRSRS